MKHMGLVVLLFLAGSCSSPGSNPLVSEVDPAFDTLYIGERSSWQVPSDISPEQNPHLLIGTTTIPIDLLFEGRAYFQAPFEPVSGEVRLAVSKTHVLLDVQHATIMPRPNPFDDRSVAISNDSGFVGEVVAIAVGNTTVDQRFRVFVAGSEASIDSIQTSRQDESVLYFTYPVSIAPSRVVVLLDSVAFNLGSFTPLIPTGNFLGKKYPIYFWGAIDVDAGCTIESQTDTGIKRERQQSHGKIELFTKKFRSGGEWKGDSLLIRELFVLPDQVHEVYASLYLHPTKNEVSGVLQFVKTIGTSVDHTVLRLEKMRWLKQGNDYQLYARGPAVKAVIPNLYSYFTESKPQWFRHAMDQYRGGTRDSEVRLMFRAE